MGEDLLMPRSVRATVSRLGLDLREPRFARGCTTLPMERDNADLLDRTSSGSASPNRTAAADPAGRLGRDNLFQRASGALFAPGHDNSLGRSIGQREPDMPSLRRSVKEVGVLRSHRLELVAGDADEGD